MAHRVDRGAVRLGDVLRAARRRRGWSRETLAHHSGLSWSAISQIETGRRSDVRLNSLIALADALTVPVDYLVRAAVEPPALFHHRLVPYSSDADLTEFAGRFLAEDLGDTEMLLVVLPRPQLAALRTALEGLGSRVVFEDAAAWHRTPDQAVERLRNFIRNARERGAPWIRVVGEPVCANRSEAHCRAWARYESLLNLLFAGAPATLVCLYNERTSPPRLLADVRRVHPEIGGPDGFVPTPEYEPPERFLTTVA